MHKTTCIKVNSSVQVMKYFDDATSTIRGKQRISFSLVDIKGEKIRFNFDCRFKGIVDFQKITCTDRMVSVDNLIWCSSVLNFKWYRGRDSNPHDVTTTGF